jgi:Fe-S cluster assembly ATP-binding protein
MLEVKNVKVGVNGNEILKGVNLVVEDRSIHSLLGVNGTGKSTLANVIMGTRDYKISSGEIIFDGKKIDKLSITERAKLGITIAWQNVPAFEGITVYEYINIHRNLKKSFIEECLYMVGLSPEKYLLRYVDDNLSGGERKRIELASIIAMKPKLAILDEVDSGIDFISLDDIKNVIRKIKEFGGSVLLITHNENIVTISDKTSIMCGGVIVDTGKPKDMALYFKKECKQCDHINCPTKSL